MGLIELFKGYFFGCRRMAVEYIDIESGKVLDYDELRKMMRENISDPYLPDYFARQVRLIKTGKLFEED